MLMSVGVGARLARPQSNDDYYRGKTLRLVVGSSAGGGYDREARLLARHLARHVPGSPRVVVENVPGAGGLVLANTLAGAVTPDGLTVGFFPSAVVIGQLTGNRAVRFDLKRFEILGSAYGERLVCVFTAASGVRTLEHWKASRRPMKLGATSPDSTMQIFPALLQDALHLPVHVVSGYRGVAEVRLAMASGELDGGCLNWATVRTSFQARDGIALVVQAGLAPHPDLPDVPVASAFASTASARAMLGTVMDALGSAARFYAIPPGTPVERRDVLRRGLLATVRDPACLQDARQSGITFDPMSGDELAARILEIFSLPPALLDQMKRAVAL